MAAVAELKAAKATYKDTLGHEYDEKKPPSNQVASSASSANVSAHTTSSNAATSVGMDLFNQTKAIGEKVRSLKAAKAGKDAVMAAVGELKAAKAKYKEATGVEYGWEV